MRKIRKVSKGTRTTARKISGTALAAGPYARRPMSVEYRTLNDVHLPLGDLAAFYSVHRIQRRSWGPAASAVPLICVPTKQVKRRTRHDVHLPLGDLAAFYSVHRIQRRSWGPAASAVPLICSPRGVAYGD